MALDDFAQGVQQKAEEHLMACWDSEEEDGDSPAFAPFCGCQTCIVREVLMVVWEEMWEEVKREHAAGGAYAPIQLVREGDDVRLVPRSSDD